MPTLPRPVLVGISQPSLFDAIASGFPLLFTCGKHYFDQSAICSELISLGPILSSLHNGRPHFSGGGGGVATGSVGDQVDVAVTL